MQELFDSLVDVIIHAQQFKDANPGASIENITFNEQSESDHLRIELNRVLHMEGGREVLEKAQETALKRLETYEKARLKTIDK